MFLYTHRYSFVYTYMYVCLYKWRQETAKKPEDTHKTLSFWTFAWPSLLLLLLLSLLLLLLLFLLLLCDLLFLLLLLLLLLYCFVMLSSALSFTFLLCYALLGFQNKCEYCAFSITKLTFESISRYIELFVSVCLPVCLSDWLPGWLACLLVSLSPSLTLCVCMRALRASVCMHRATKTTGNQAACLPGCQCQVAHRKKSDVNRLQKSFNSLLFI